MSEPTTPTTFHLDTISANGTPFRFVLTPQEERPERSSVRYYDRRYASAPGEFGYHPSNFNEHGQGCGGARSADDFMGSHDFGLRGWHEVDAWDVDVHTRRLVGTWIANVLGLETR